MRKLASLNWIKTFHSQQLNSWCWKYKSLWSDWCEQPRYFRSLKNIQAITMRYCVNIWQIFFLYFVLFACERAHATVSVYEKALYFSFKYVGRAQNKKLINDQASKNLENIDAEVKDLIQNPIEGKVKYLPSLCTFALTLQFYSARLTIMLEKHSTHAECHQSTLRWL